MTDWQQTHRSRLGSILAPQLEEWEAQAASSDELRGIAGSLTRSTEYLFGWEAAAHHAIWAAKLQALYERRLKDAQGRSVRRLLIVAPPATAKTNWAGVAGSTYYLGHHPEHHELYISSAIGQALKVSVAVRDTIRHNRRFAQLFPGVVPDRGKGWADKRWFLERDNPGDKDPSFFAAGVGSQEVLGSRADNLGLDDVCTQENTATAYRRDKLKEWVRQTAFSRETQDAVQWCIMTRWHSDDLAHFLETEGGYEVVVMAALGYWEDPDAYHASPKRAFSIEGESLWPEEYDRDHYLGKLVEAGPAGFARMYQGSPVPEGGQLFKEAFWQPYYVPHTHPQAQEVLQRHGRALTPPYNAVVVERQGHLESVPLTHAAVLADTAMKEVDTADYSVFALWGVGIDRQAYLLDLWRRQIDSNQLLDALIRFHLHHRPDIWGIEDRASGTQLIQDVQQKTAIPIAVFNPLINKVERARVQTHVVAGALHLPNPDLMEPIDPARTHMDIGMGAEDVTDLIAEHAEFPAGRNDDMVDTTVMAAEQLRPLLDWFVREETDVPPGLMDLSGLARRDGPPARTGPQVVTADMQLASEMGEGWSGGREGWPSR